MFESFRQTIRDLMDRATPPEERRAGLARMKQTLVTARMGLDDLRGGITLTRQRLQAEVREQETMRRRKAAAAAISDAETVALAEKYEAVHTERASVLTRKLEAQEAELAIAERDVEEMAAELKTAMLGAAPAGARTTTLGDELDKDLGVGGDSSVAEELDGIGRARARAARDAEAEQRLAELKRRMGK
jgi:hypothetical protein